MTVRWDAVVQDNGFWSDPARPAQAAAVCDTSSPQRVQVWLFGSLASAVEERPITLHLESPFCVDQVIAELGRRYGIALLARITTPAGTKARNCRIFVNGEPVRDTAAPVQAATTPAQIELVLLSALEGG